MASGGIGRLPISKLLNHVEKDITRVYDRYSCDREKREALDAWALTFPSILHDIPR